MSHLVVSSVIDKSASSTNRACIDKVYTVSLAESVEFEKLNSIQSTYSVYRTPLQYSLISVRIQDVKQQMWAVC